MVSRRLWITFLMFFTWNRFFILSTRKTPHHSPFTFASKLKYYLLRSPLARKLINWRMIFIISHKIDNLIISDPLLVYYYIITHTARYIQWTPYHPRPPHRAIDEKRILFLFENFRYIHSLLYIIIYNTFEGLVGLLLLNIKLPRDCYSFHL